MTFPGFFFSKFWRKMEFSHLTQKHQEEIKHITRAITLVTEVAEELAENDMQEQVKY
jgi:hypothetical protein